MHEVKRAAARRDERGRLARHDRRSRRRYRRAPPTTSTASWRRGPLPIRIYAMLRDSPEARQRDAIGPAHARVRRAAADARGESVGRRRARQSRRGADAGLQRSAAPSRPDDVHARADAGAGDADGSQGLAAERACHRRRRQPPRARHARDAADEGATPRAAPAHRARAGDRARRHPHASRGSR